MSTQGIPEAEHPIASDATTDTKQAAERGTEPVDEFSARDAGETDEEPNIFRGLE